MRSRSCRPRLEVDRAVRFLPYQERDRAVAIALDCGGLHVVGLASGLSGYVVPSRLYGVLAVGRPVIVAADAESETSRSSRKQAAARGRPGRPDLVAGAIRDVVERRVSLDGMGERGRAWVEGEADREVAFNRYRRLVADVVASSSR